MALVLPKYTLQDLLEDAAKTGDLPLLEQDLERVTLRDLMKDPELGDLLQWLPVDHLLRIRKDRQLEERVRVISKGACPISLVRRSENIDYDRSNYCCNCEITFPKNRELCPRCRQPARRTPRSR